MKQMKDKGRVAVALSGGVDSTAAAIRLMEEGYKCFGITMYLFDLPNEVGEVEPPAFLKDARRVADELGIEHHIIDMRAIFKDKIMLPFANAYLAGKTPNPCVLCNRSVKYGLLLDKAIELGADYMATGHYARNVFNTETGKYELYKGLADRKDQAYVMHGLSQNQLKHILFPNGSFLSKDEIREIVSRKGIFTAAKKDSMGICFVPDGNYGRVIENLKPGAVKQGNFVKSDGEILGKHKGMVYYTIGQKRNLGIDLPHPMFVVELNAKTNEVVLGKDKDTYAKSIITDAFHLISGEINELPHEVDVKMFNWGWMLKAKTRLLDKGQVEIIFDKPERAPVCGQHAVIYNGERILGGGLIIEVIK